MQGQRYQQRSARPQQQLHPQRQATGGGRAPNYYPPQQYYVNLPIFSTPPQHPMSFNLQQQTHYPYPIWYTEMGFYPTNTTSQSLSPEAQRRCERLLVQIKQLNSYMEAATASMSALPRIESLSTDGQDGCTTVQLKTKHTGIPVTNWHDPRMLDIAYDAPLDWRCKTDALAALKLGAMIKKYEEIDLKLHKLLQKFAGRQAFVDNYKETQSAVSKAQWEAFWIEDHDIRVHIAELQNWENGLVTELCRDFKNFSTSANRQLPKHPHLACWVLYIQDFLAQVASLLAHMLSGLVSRFQAFIHHDTAARVVKSMIEDEDGLGQCETWREDFRRCILSYLRFKQGASKKESKYTALKWSVMQVGEKKFQRTDSSPVHVKWSSLMSRTIISYNGWDDEEKRRSQILRGIAQAQNDFLSMPLPALNTAVPPDAGKPTPSRKRKREDGSADVPQSKKPAPDRKIISASSDGSPAASSTACGAEANLNLKHDRATRSSSSRQDLKEHTPRQKQADVHTSLQDFMSHSQVATGVDLAGSQTQTQSDDSVTEAHGGKPRIDHNNFNIAGPAPLSSSRTVKRKRSEEAEVVDFQSAPHKSKFIKTGKGSGRRKHLSIKKMS